MSPFRACYFRTFEKFSAFRTSAPRLVVRRYGGVEVLTMVRKCSALEGGGVVDKVVRVGSGIRPSIGS
ncbi:hypothetical protein E2C01_067802 [Portunus trituberculatus]|uniref:Uncharacterized protein n=1 Tax=Portunus trituberculatus TaxID=210409 RepID=A0A5B7HQA0_PORTR|nr:hypothetical protein [Portunus trituberculatus]